MQCRAWPRFALTCTSVWAPGTRVLLSAAPQRDRRGPGASWSVRPAGWAAMVTRAVLDALHALVPEEVRDVEAVLPAGLKPLWADPTAAET